MPNNGDRQGSAFLNFALDATYNWQRSSGDSYNVGYSFEGDFYKDLSEVNLADHTVFAGYRHAFNERVSGSFRLSDTYTMLGGDGYRNQVAFSPTLSFRHSERAVTELSYSLALNNYQDFNGPDVQDRDGKSHSLTLAHYFSPKNTRFQLRGGAFYTRNQADGDDYDYNSIGLFAGVSHPLPWKTTGDLSYFHSRDRYDEENSLSAPAFSTKRRDNVDSISFQLNKPLKSEGKYKLDAYLRYSHTRDDSNIGFFQYRQNIVSLGINGQF